MTYLHCFSLERNPLSATTALFVSVSNPLSGANDTRHTTLRRVRDTEYAVGVITGTSTVTTTRVIRSVAPQCARTVLCNTFSLDESCPRLHDHQTFMMRPLALVHRSVTAELSSLRWKTQPTPDNPSPSNNVPNLACFIRQALLNDSRSQSVYKPLAVSARRLDRSSELTVSALSCLPSSF